MVCTLSLDGPSTVAKCWHKTAMIKPEHVNRICLADSTIIIPEGRQANIQWDLAIPQARTQLQFPCV